MKVILTESQIKQFSAIEGVKNLLEESVSLNETSSLIKDHLRNALIAGVACISIIAGINASGVLSDNEKRDYISYTERKAREVEEAKQEFYQLRVNELEKCMHDKYLQLKGHSAYNKQDIVLSPSEMVKSCDEYGYDLVLMAAQAWLESAWGTTPRALKTKSVFSVGSYDNGKDVAKYNHVNASIVPYIQLMQGDYNMNKDTLNNIFSGKSTLVNNAGNRYASSPVYERQLKKTYDAIKSSYPILSMSFEDYMKKKEKENPF